jgi:hypothetical protein
MTATPSGASDAPDASDAGGADEALTCSARGCTRAASWQLLWNNPRLHTPDRRKTWLACDDHRESLSDFLGARGFLRDVEPVAPGPAAPPSR